MSGQKDRFRRGIRVFLVLLLVSSVALAGLSYPFYTTTTDSVRLRKSASSRAVVMENLAAGTEIEVLGKTGSYYKVKVDGQTGYILQDFVNTDAGAISTATPEVEETVTGYPYASVTREQVNLRESKSVSSKLLKKIPAASSIVVRGVSGSWAEIEYDGYVGYVKKTYIVIKKVVTPTPTPTPVPTLSPEESASAYIVLQKGSEGAEVKALQEALTELGFMNGKADGKFGSATENAVNLFQQANEYPITGVVDANLQAFLYSGKPKNAKGEATKVNTVSPVSGASMSLNSTGDPVGSLQERLQELGYYTGEINRTFDKATQSAVKAFQKANGLKADGVAGQETQELLYSDSVLDADATPTPTPEPTATPVPTFTIPSGKVQRGSEGTDAKLVQSRLKDLGYYRGRVDGKFGAQSVAALKSFQTANGLEADGIAGESTYMILFSFGALASGVTATPAMTETPTPEVTAEPSVTPEAAAQVVFETLRKGDRGDAVKLMQEALINLGYLNGSSDGIYGDSTVQAVRSFQRANGLKVDGTAGNETLTRLYSTQAVAAPTAAPTATPTATPAATAAPTAAPTAAASENLRQGSAGDAVRALQERLIALGYLTGKADGKFGAKTYAALVAFQRANRLKPDGIAGAQTQAALNSSSAVAASSTATAAASATATPAPSSSNSTGTSVTPTAGKVIYANWYTSVKAVARKYPYATIYDYQTGISWQIHIFSLGAHADYEPLTASDTSRMEKVFGGSTWNPRAVWVIFADGRIYMASTHSMPHGTQHNTGNNFDGHSCLHFPRTQEQVEAIGTYATSHQQTIDVGWAVTQSMR